MNPSDRSIRAGWQQFSLYSVLIMVFVGLFTNLALIAFAVETLYIPLTIIIILDLKNKLDNLISEDND